MSVYKRGDGRWQVLVDLDRGADGRRRRRALGVYRTKKEAESAERKAKQDRERGVDLNPKTVTVADLLTCFVADRRAKGRAIRTVARYAELAREQIAPHLGALALAKLTPAHVSAWLALLLERGGVDGGPLAPRTARHAFTLLRSALRWAVRHDLVMRNVAEAVDPPTTPRSQAKALGEDDVARLLAASDKGRWGPFIRVALGTGARRGELLALCWSDVDFESATLTIARAVVEVWIKGQGAQVTEKTTKTDRVRTIPLAPMVVEALRKQRTMQAADKLAAGPAFTDSGHVFQGPLGGRLAPSAATEAFRGFRARLGIRGTLHDLRHTAATWMIAGGIDLRTVASVLGHSATSTTLNTYAHVVRGAEAKAVAAIERRLKKEA
jgi:integrase